MRCTRLAGVSILHARQRRSPSSASPFEACGRTTRSRCGRTTRSRGCARRRVSAASLRSRCQWLDEMHEFHFEVENLSCPLIQQDPYPPAAPVQQLLDLCSMACIRIAQVVSGRSSFRVVQAAERLAWAVPSLLLYRFKTRLLFRVFSTSPLAITAVDAALEVALADSPAASLQAVH